MSDERLLDEGLSPPMLSGGVVPRWAERPVAKFERNCLAAGRTITDLT